MFGCSNNSLYNLPSLPNKLIDLVCSNNHLNQLPELPGHLAYLDCFRNNIICLPNLPKSMGGASPFHSKAIYNLKVNFYINPYIHCLPNLVPGIRLGTWNAAME